MFEMTSVRVGTPSYELQAIQDKHKEVLRLATIGLSKRRIAEELGVTVVTVANVLGSRCSQMHLAFLQRLRDTKSVAVAERIQETAARAMEVIESALDGDLPLEPKEQVRTAFGLLDRAGFGPTRNINAKHLIGIVTPEMLDSINKAVEDVNCPAD